MALGVGAAMVEPAVFALIKATVPADRQARAFRVQAAGFLAGGGLGPIVSGAITTGLSWEYVFGLNVVVSAGVLAVATALIPDPAPGGVAGRVDVAGLALGAAGLFCLVFPIVEGARLGWGAPVIVGAFLASPVLLALFVITELRAREPLVRLQLFRNPRFAGADIARALTEFASIGVFFAISHFLQVQLGYSAMVTGALLMAVIGAAVAVSPIVEALTGRVDVRWLVVPGFLLTAVATFWVAHLSPQTGWAFFLAPLAILGAGIGALEEPLDTVARRSDPGAQSGPAWRLSYITYLLGIGFGVAVVAAVWQSQVRANISDALAESALPAEVTATLSAAMSAGGVSGQPAEQLTGAVAARLQAPIQEAFAEAVNAAVLSCTVAALLGAVVALTLLRGNRDGPVGDVG